MIAATQTTPPGETTHWTSGAMAKHIGISVSSVQRIWRRHGLQPHKTRLFKLSNDPLFAEKVIDIVGLYVSPPEHAVVRWTFHFTPTSASWLNAVEGYFAKLTKRRLQRGVFCPVVELQAAIKRFLAETNADPRPFRWTKDPAQIIAAVKRGHQVLDSNH